MYQTTIKIEGFVTITTKEKITEKNLSELVFSIDAHEEYLPDTDYINETDITSKEITNTTEIK